MSMKRNLKPVPRADICTDDTLEDCLTIVAPAELVFCGIGLSGHPVHVSYEFQMVSTDDDNGSDISDRFDDGKSWSRVAYALRKFSQDQRKDGRRIGCIERLSIK
ncbi:hypothetical protein V1477_020991, partial [Vespula maculifrons]